MCTQKTYSFLDAINESLNSNSILTKKIQSFEQDCIQEYEIRKLEKNDILNYLITNTSTHRWSIGNDKYDIPVIIEEFIFEMQRIASLIDLRDFDIPSILNGRLFDYELTTIDKFYVWYLKKQTKETKQKEKEIIILEEKNEKLKKANQELFEQLQTQTQTK